MGTETGLALRPQGGALEISTLTDVERLATLAVASGLVQVRRAEEAAMLLITGRELGLSPMQSLRGIYVVSGRPVLSADLMVAVIRRSGLCRSWRVLVSTAAECTIETQREGESESARKTWTADDARRAADSGGDARCECGPLRLPIAGSSISGLRIVVLPVAGLPIAGLLRRRFKK